MITYNETNASAATLYLRYAGNNITFRITVTPVVDLADTSVPLGQLNLNKIAAMRGSMSKKQATTEIGMCQFVCQRSYSCSLSNATYYYI